jgi:Tfp pilus assembly protein PilF
MLRRVFSFAGLIAIGVAFGTSCRRPELPEATHREAVTAFYTALAAMQTSQELLARRDLERVIQLAPDEPAGWANLGLLLLRQQEVDSARTRLAKAAALAPRSAAIQRLLGLLESRNGRLLEAIRHWRRAAELDPSDLKAPYALALDIERQGGNDGLLEAQRVLESLLAKAENLAVRLELARVAAKQGDAAGLRKAVAPLPEMSRGWPAAAIEQLSDLQAALTDPRAAATRVAFLKNVLLREPEFRRSMAAVSPPFSEVGEPLAGFLALPNPESQPAPADTSLAFSVDELKDQPTPGLTLSVASMWLTGEGMPIVVAADGEEVRLPNGARAKAPGGKGPGPVEIVAADFNYDYRTDMLLVGAGGLKLLRQDDGGRFVDATAATRLKTAVLNASAFGAWAADVDTEGDLDVVVAPTDGKPLVLRNNGDGTFAELRPFAGIDRLRGFVWTDFDGDGVPDAALLDADGTVRVYTNLRGGVFRQEPVAEGLPKLVALAPIEGSDLFDILGLTADGTLVRLSSGGGRGQTTRTLARVPDFPPGLSPGSARLLIAELDNNGAVDVIVAGPTASRVLLGGPAGALQLLPAPLSLQAIAAADLDSDGRIEILGVTDAGRAVRATSRGVKAYHWQTLRPRSATATGDQRINSFGVGGEVELRTGLHLQKRTIDAPVVHFGLGDATRAEVLRILWPNGVLQSDFNLPANTTVAASQRLKGSCPWLFAWNGREMAFVTDLIWRSPLGLRINAQLTAETLMTEDWIKLRGDQLVARDGAYDLRVTAELWETHFFDTLSLSAIDHPEGTEVFVDERFAMPQPKLAVHVTGPVREWHTVRDDTGRDVADLAKERDNRHIDFAGRGPYQGVTRDHYVELELPDDAPRNGPLWLVGQGWVHPTDSSVNVAIGQGKHAQPNSLSLHVADAAGRFRKVREELGFPSGKDKTVLLDLTGVFPAQGPRRLRLATNLEVFWDRLGWAEGRPDVPVARRRSDLASAELLYRGYSVTEQTSISSPERPRYLLEGTAPRWLDLEGYHTRFGDVRELLAKVDDRYVIMNAGDEIRLRFPELPALTAGMVRDFVLVGDGWVKDGDFNTTFSRTVLPLPTHASGRYSRTPSHLEDDPVYRAHRRDFEEYHTRYVSPEDARRALRQR